MQGTKVSESRLARLTEEAYRKQKKRFKLSVFSVYFVNKSFNQFREPLIPERCWKRFTNLNVYIVLDP